MVALFIVAYGCGAKTVEPVGGRPVVRPVLRSVQPKQGVAIAAACKCEVVIRETRVLEENFDDSDFVCAPSGVSACCIKLGTAGHRPFDLAAWYEANHGVDYDQLDPGDEIPGNSAWVVGAHVVVFRDPYSTDAFCASYESGVLTMQTMFRARH